MNRNQNQQTLVVFHLADRLYAVPSQQVEQIVPMADLIRPAGLPRFLLGFLNLHGEPLPVVSLHHLFGLPGPTIGLWTPLIILEANGRRFAVMVDEVTQVITLQPNQPAAVPVPQGQVFNDCVTSVVPFPDGVILLLAPERLLLEQEQHVLAMLQAMAADRLHELEGATT